MRVNVDSSFFSDPRLTMLAGILGRSIMETRGLLITLWHECYRLKSSFVPVDKVEILASWPGESGVFCTALLRSNLASKNDENGTLKIAGVEARISWLEKQSQKGIRSAERRLERKLHANLREVQPLSTGVEPRLKNKRFHPVNVNQIQPHLLSYSEFPSTEIQIRESMSNKDRPGNDPGDVGLAPSSAVADTPPPFENFSGRNSEAQKFVNLWNEKCGHITRALRMTKKRGQAIKLRLKETPLEKWGPILDRVAASPFCQGEKGWKASIDWVLRPDTAIKIQEGLYDGKQKASFAEPMIMLGDRLE